MAKHAVCYTDELLPGERRIVDVAGRSIGVFNVANEFHAVRNRCPHKGAPLCLGMIKGLVVGSKPYEYEITREGQILKCPWHGWEFDLTTGESVFNPHKMRVKRYAISVEAGPRFEAQALGDACQPEHGGEDSSIETYAISVEPVESNDRQMVFLHVG